MTNFIGALENVRFQIKDKTVESLKWPRKNVNFTIKFGLPVFQLFQLLKRQKQTKTFFPDHIRDPPLKFL